MQQRWDLLGEGTYNRAYRSSDGKLILKVAKTNEPTDTPIRSVRIWNQINPSLQPPAQIVEFQGYLAWTCPYVKGRQSTDSEMRWGIIDVFNRTGRIVVDATAPNNFITTPKGEVICIDIGMALSLERNEEKQYSGRRQRTNSITSDNAWAWGKSHYTPYFRKAINKYPKTVDTVKALLFIRMNRPDIFDANFLKNNSELTAQLAEAYEAKDYYQTRNSENITRKANIALNKAIEQRSEQIDKAQQNLEKIRPINFENIKESCVNELRRYIQSRGKIESNVFKPSFITWLFRDQAATLKKVNQANNLITIIQSTKDYSQLSIELRAVIKNETIMGAKFRSGFASTLGRIEDILSSAQKNNPSLSANAHLMMR